MLVSSCSCCSVKTIPSATLKAWIAARCRSAKYCLLSKMILRAFMSWPTSTPISPPPACSCCSSLMVSDQTLANAVGIDELVEIRELLRRGGQLHPYVAEALAVVGDSDVRSVRHDQFGDEMQRRPP